MTGWTIAWTDTALRQSAAVQAWWAENRAEAPTLFVDELLDLVELLRAQPRAGLPYAHPTSTQLRRVLLVRSRYQLYYRLDEARREIALVAIWHALRGSGPPLDG